MPYTYSHQSKPLYPDVAIAKILHGRHRVRRTFGTPDLLGLCISRNAEFCCDFVVIGREIGIVDRPVEAAIVLAFDFEIVWQIAREVRKVVKRRAAYAPTRLVCVAVWILTFEEERDSGRLDASAPKVGADEIWELPVRTGF